MPDSKITIEVSSKDLVDAVNAFFWPGQPGPLTSTNVKSVSFEGEAAPPDGIEPIVWDDASED